MTGIRPKKSLGQHFLKDASIARRIVSSLRAENCQTVLEVGPGMGILTGYLLERKFNDFRVVEIDCESVSYLKAHFPELNIIHDDFLKMEIGNSFGNKLAVIGNFPYNISSQIFFKILENRDRVAEACGMLQKEVAERICSAPGSRIYGILSVFIRAFYDIEYLFPVSNTVFSPPPKVQSAVIRIVRNGTETLDCDEKLFFKVVKSCFNQRRKTLRNSVKAAFVLKNYDNDLMSLRPEQLSVEQFVSLTNWIEDRLNSSK
jgi:16S rRNA (adenine1518-N6/adenine1519-N6)-dimethyltransferase